MFKNIDEYMRLSLKDRQKHLRLNTKCTLIGINNSAECRALLAHTLKTTAPKGKEIHLCHACNNPKCSNPNHLYWGTRSENVKDYINATGVTLNDHLEKKYSLKEIKRIRSDAGRKGGKACKGWKQRREHSSVGRANA